MASRFIQPKRSLRIISAAQSGLAAKVLAVTFLGILIGTFLLGEPVGAQDLRCLDIVGCRSKAGCGTAGSPLGCILQCQDGSTIFCPYNEVGGGCEGSEGAECEYAMEVRGCDGYAMRVISLASRGQCDVLRAFAQVWARRGDLKRSRLLLKLAGSCGPAVIARVGETP